MLRAFRLGFAAAKNGRRSLPCNFCTTPTPVNDSDKFGDYAGPSEPKRKPKEKYPKEERREQFRKPDDRISRNRSSRREEDRISSRDKKSSSDFGDVFGTLSSERKPVKTIVDYKLNASYAIGEEEEDELEDMQLQKNDRSTKKKKSESELDAEKEEELFADEPEFRPFVVAKHSQEHFQQMQRKLGSQGKIAEMVAVLEKRMLEDRVRPTDCNFREAITFLGKYGQPRKAFEFYKKMQRMEIRPPLKVTTSLFNACANCSPVEKEWAMNQSKLLLSDLRGVYGALRPAQYHAAIKVFARHGDLAWAFRIADFMVSDRVKPNVVTFTHLLQACISDRSSGFKLALDVWRAMHSFRIRADELFYNSILRACRDCGLGPDGDRVVEGLASQERLLRRKLIEQKCDARQDQLELRPLEEKEWKTSGGLVPSLEELTEKLDRLEVDNDDKETKPKSMEADDGKKTEAVAVFVPETNFKLALLRGINGVLELMDRDKAPPSIKTFSLLLDLLPRSNIEEENRLMESMKTRKVKPDVDFINALIARRCRRGQFESALALLNECKVHGLQPNERTFSSLALGCKTYTMGMSLLRDMQTFGITPNFHILAPLLLQALRTNRRYNFYYAMSVMSWVKKSKLELSLDNLKHLERSCKEAKEIEDKRRVANAKRQGDQEIKDGMPPVWGLNEFWGYYETWLKHVRVKDESIDPKLKLLDKVVTADDLREDWEKPWVAQAEEEKRKEMLAKAKMIPVA